LGIPQSGLLHSLRGKYLIAILAKLYVRCLSWMPFELIKKEPRTFVRNTQKKYFCQQLSSWLLATQWHFTTLLSVCINSINKLPNDVDHFVNCLLLSYPSKPTGQQLNDYVSNSSVIEHWLKNNTNRPKIKAFNLDTIPVAAPNHDLPCFGSINDLARWLDVSLTQLDWLADLKRVDINQAEKYKHYHYHSLTKRRGGIRIIESPKTILKEVQRHIHINLLSKVSPHHSAHGFRKNHSCLSHAKNHTHQQYLFTFDLDNYFHSIDWFCVYKVFTKLGYNNEIANYLSALCTHKFIGDKSLLIALNSEQRKKIKQRHLAQGAPTSPALSNLVMTKLDKRLDGLAKSLQLNYSRYADDLAFSGNKHRDWRFLEPLIASICLEEGFKLNHRKSKTIHCHQRQKITGIIVNQGTNIDRRYFDQIKATLTNCIRHGIENQNINGHENFQSHLLGQIIFVSSLNKNRGEKLFKLYQKISFA